METLQRRIMQLLQKGEYKPGQMATMLGVSRQFLHQHLKNMLEQGLISKHGTGSHVSYSLAESSLQSRVQGDYSLCKEMLLPKYMKTFHQSIPRYLETFLKEHATDREKGTFDFGFLLEAGAVSSSNIEGNTLDLNAFLNSRNAQKKHRPKEAQEIEDLIRAYHFAQSKPLTEKNMLHAHRILSASFVSPTRQGTYRQESVGVYSRSGLVYVAAEHYVLQKEIRELFRCITRLKKGDLAEGEALFWGSWVHLLIALIHPFADGNGRTARLYEKWFLAQTLGKEYFFLPTEEQYWHHRSEYYSALKLGVNYWETKLDNALPFFMLLPESLLESK